MNYQKKYSKGSGNKGRSSREGGFQSNSINYKTRCAECGNDCTVPFRPNGRKPVLCSQCFENEQGGSKRFDSSDKKPFKKSFDKPRYSERTNNAGMESELKLIRKTLEQILEILQETTIEESDE